MTWRPMTAEETVSRSEARLEGSLLLVVLCAAALAVGAVIFLLFAMLAIPAAVTSGVAGMLSQVFRGPGGVGFLYMIPTLYLMIWALMFSIMTVMRSAAAPSAASVGLAVWLGLRLAVGIAGQIWITSRYNSGPGLVLQAILPIMLGIVGDTILAAGFWVYMREGVRPNGYYRGLVRA